MSVCVIVFNGALAEAVGRMAHTVSWYSDAVHSDELHGTVIRLVQVLPPEISLGKPLIGKEFPVPLAAPLSVAAISDDSVLSPLGPKEVYAASLSVDCDE